MIYFDTSVWDFIYKNQDKNLISAIGKSEVILSPVNIQQLGMIAKSDPPEAQRVLEFALNISKAIFKEHSQLLKMCLDDIPYNKADLFLSPEIKKEIQSGLSSLTSGDPELVGIVSQVWKENTINMKHFKKNKRLWIDNRKEITKGKRFKDFIEDSFQNPGLDSIVNDILVGYGITGVDIEDYKTRRDCFNFFLRVLLSRFYFHDYLGRSGINEDILIDIMHHIYGWYCDTMVTRDNDMLEIYRDHIIASSPQYKIPNMITFDEFKINIGI